MDDLVQGALARLRETSRIDYFACLLNGEAETIALRAFHGEIVAIPFKVREPMAGEVRLQWWRDVVNGERRDEARADPVAALLSSVLDERSDWRLPLLAKLEAHVADLYADPFPDWNAFDGYAGETRSVLFQLSAVAAGADRSIAEAAGHAGVLETIADRLSAWPLLRSRSMPILPTDDVREAADHALSSARTASEALGEASGPVRSTFRRLRVDRRRVEWAKGHPERLRREGFQPLQATLQWDLWRGA